MLSHFYRTRDNSSPKCYGDDRRLTSLLLLLIINTSAACLDCSSCRRPMLTLNQALVTVVITACLVFTNKLFVPSPDAKGRLMDQTSQARMDCGGDAQNNDRLFFGSGPSNTVYGWPSYGGLHVLDDCSAVELDFLGLDRFVESSRSQDPEEEDAHCAKMRKLGASWWPSHKHYAMKDVFSGQRPEDRQLIVGWPGGGGVWVIDTTLGDSGDRGLGRVKNAHDMEQQSLLIERHGGQFYADPRDCPHLDLDGAKIRGHERVPAVNDMTGDMVEAMLKEMSED